MAASGSGTTFPRGLPNADSISGRLFPLENCSSSSTESALSKQIDGQIDSRLRHQGAVGSHDKALLSGPGVILGRKGHAPRRRVVCHWLLGHTTLHTLWFHFAQTSI